MKLLLDTHILLWLLAGSDRLDKAAMAVIEDAANQVFASTISVWEVAIKYSLRRGAPDDMPLSGRDFAAALADAGVEVLDVRPAHAAALDTLPMLHRDPFDRMLLATAREEGMNLVTRDAALAAYEGNVWLI